MHIGTLDHGMLAELARLFGYAVLGLAVLGAGLFSIELALGWFVDRRDDVHPDE